MQLRKACSVLIENLSTKGLAEPMSQLTSRQQYLECRLMTRIRNSAELPEDEVSRYNGDRPAQYQANVELLHKLIEMEAEQGVLKICQHIQKTFPATFVNGLVVTLVRHGLSDCLQDLALEEPKTNGLEERMLEDVECASVLHQACARDLPNLDVPKVLVTNKKYNPNVIDRSSAYVNDPAPLHILAKSPHWWKAHGITYLDQHGADIDIEDSDGCTPLHTAIDHHAIRNAKTLLRQGAKPDVIAKNGTTCLNKAVSSPELVRNPMDSNLVSSIVRNKPQLNSGFTAERRSGRWDRRPLNYVYKIQDNHLDIVYPLHLAASQQYNDYKKLAKAVTIIEILLQHGADPLKECSPGHMILHELCKNEGIVKTILEHVKPNFEHRDGEGNTLLLAACCARFAGCRWEDRDKRIAYFQTLPSLVAMLLSKGARIDATNDRKQNALHLLFDQRSLYSKPATLLRKDLAIILAAAGASGIINQPDDRGLKPLF